MIEFLRFLNYMLYQSNMFQRYKQKAFLTVEETTHKKVMNLILKFKKYIITTVFFTSMNYAYNKFKDYGAKKITETMTGHNPGSD